MFSSSMSSSLPAFWFHWVHSWPSCSCSLPTPVGFRDDVGASQPGEKEGTGQKESLRRVFDVCWSFRVKKLSTVISTSCLIVMHRIQKHVDHKMSSMRESVTNARIMHRGQSRNGLIVINWDNVHTRYSSISMHEYCSHFNQISETKKKITEKLKNWKYQRERDGGGGGGEGEEAKAGRQH